MSRNRTAHPQEMAVSKEALQERWKQLNLKPSTLLHLQEVLDTLGIAAAATITEAVVREKEKETPVTTIGKEWGSEALRLLSLEGVRPHLVDWLRVALEGFISWHLISLPEGVIDQTVQITLAALLLLVSLIGICLFRHKQKPKAAKKSV